MVTVLLNFAYLALLTLASPYLIWSAIARGKYREGFAEKVLGRVPLPKSANPIWIHAVSVGEVNLLGPLLAEILARDPDQAIYITTTTRTGLELARTKFPQHSVSYAPLDFSWGVNTALSRIQPSALILVELELWPNLIRMTHRRGIPISLVNARMSPKSHCGYAKAKWLIAPLLQKLQTVAVQDETYAARFIDLGVVPQRLHVTGSIKFDGVSTDRDNPATLRLKALVDFPAGAPVWVAGSTQPGEEAMALEVFRKIRVDFPELRLLLVPRHPHRFDEVARLLEDSRLPLARRSQHEVPSPALSESAVLLIDTIGELSAWWGLADIALVGGSFGNRGGQNMLEPAAYGAAVCFGPHTWNFKEVVAKLREVEGAVEVDSAESLEDFVRHCLTAPEEAAQMGERAQALIHSQRGATARTVDLLPLGNDLAPANAWKAA
ncbi:MAG: 3-deoxy-D-manno-octulosonic acid transferase [Pirellulaceae bacterium]